TGTEKHGANIRLRWLRKACLPREDGPRAVTHNVGSFARSPGCEQKAAVGRRTPLLFGLCRYSPRSPPSPPTRAGTLPFDEAAGFRFMVKKGQKRALLDAFPAWIVWLQRPGEQPYYKVQPDFKGEVLSHSLTPEGEAHARLWRESEEVPGTSRFVPASAIRHIELKAGKPALLSCPPSTATVSFAPVNYDSF